MNLQHYIVNIPRIYTLHGSGSGSSMVVSATSAQDAAREAVKKLASYSWPQHDEGVLITTETEADQVARGRVQPKPEDEIIVSWPHVVTKTQIVVRVPRPIKLPIVSS